MMDDWKTRPTLISRIKDKPSNENWEEFTAFYEPYVKGFLRRLGLQPDKVDDFSQMAFLKLWESIEHFELKQTSGTFRAWFKTIMRNNAINYFKRESMISKKLKDYALINKLDQSPNVIDEIIEDEWNIFISNEAWNNCSEKFSENEKNTFLESLEGKTTEEIAQKIGIRTATVYCYKKKVKDQLKREIKRLQEIY